HFCAAEHDGVMEPLSSPPVTSRPTAAGGIMDMDKSIIEKFTETVKSLADSASEALKSEEPPKADQSAAGYMPFAAEGLITDPMMAPPAAAQPARRNRRAAKKAAKRSAARKSAPKRSARKAAKTSADRKSRASARQSAKLAVKTSAKEVERASAKRRTGA